MSVAEEIWQQAILPPNSTVQQAILNLNKIAIKIVLVVNEAGELLGTISDGDIRRGLLRGIVLDSSVTDIIYRNPLVVPPEVGRETVMQLMLVNKIQQIPIVNEHRHVVGLHLWDEVTTPAARPNFMFIMAGGLGKRLHPHTEECPKPMLPVAGKPMRLVVQGVGARVQHYFDRPWGEGEARAGRLVVIGESGLDRVAIQRILGA